MVVAAAEVGVKESVEEMWAGRTLDGIAIEPQDENNPRRERAEKHARPRGLIMSESSGRSQIFCAMQAFRNF